MADQPRDKLKTVGKRIDYDREYRSRNTGGKKAAVHRRAEAETGGRDRK